MDFFFLFSSFYIFKIDLNYINIKNVQNGHTQRQQKKDFTLFCHVHAFVHAFQNITRKKIGSLFSIAFPIVFISFAKRKMFTLVFFNLACAILPINLKNNFVGIFRQEKIAPIFKALQPGLLNHPVHSSIVQYIQSKKCYSLYEGVLFFAPA